MHFLLVFALIGICIYVAPVVIAATAILVWTLLVSVICGLLIFGLYTALASWPLVFTVVLPIAVICFYLFRRRIAEVIDPWSEQARLRALEEQDTARRAANAIAIWRNH